jgi:putative mRNA 3-end processing factor
VDAFDKPTLVYSKGVHLLGTMVWFDPSHRREFCAITNAGEHRIDRHERVLWSSQTAKLEENRRGSPIPGLACPFHHRFNLGPLEFELIPSGYMAGACQFLLTFPNGRRLLYSGPFSVQQSPTAESIEYTTCDILVLDATYGHEHHALPARESVYQDIRQWIDRTLDEDGTPVFLVANPGKAQDLIHILDTHGCSMRVHRSIQTVNRAFREVGIALPGCKEFRGPPNERDVVLWPEHLTDSPLLERIERPIFARLTGAARAESKIGKSQQATVFPWSARADFQELIHYTKQVSPEIVLTLGAHAQDLANTLTMQGLAASPLLRSPQMALDL